MSDKNIPQNTHPPSLLNGLIGFSFQIILIILIAGCVLLLEFLGKFLWTGHANALNAAQHIVALNHDFIGHEIAWVKPLRLLETLFTQGILALGIAVAEIVMTRCFIFLCALPCFALFLGLFATDGLVQREIRKFQGARESTFLFHRAKLCVSFFFLAPLFIFLSVPVYVSPTVFLLIQAGMMSLSVWYAMKYFKKYV